MIIGLEIGLCIAGLIALLTGRFRLGKNRVATGMAARIAGLLLLLPGPTALGAGLLVALNEAAEGRPSDAQKWQPALMALELGIIAAYALLSSGIVLAAGRPEQGDEPGRGTGPAGKRRAPGPGAAVVEPAVVEPVEDEPPWALPAGPPSGDIQDQPPAARPSLPDPVPPRRRPGVPPRGAAPVRSPHVVPWVVGGVALAGVLLICAGGALAVAWLALDRIRPPAVALGPVAQKRDAGRGPEQGAEARREAAAPAADAQARQEAERARQAADEARRRAAVEAEAAARAWREAAEARALLEAERRRADAERKKADSNAYLHRIAQAERELLALDPYRAWDLLEECRPEQRGWEWHYLKHQCRGSAVTISDGTMGGLYRVVFSPDGRRLAGASFHGGSVKVWDARTGQELLALAAHTSQVHGLAYSADGRRLVTSDGEIHVWDAASGQPILTIKDPDGYSGAVALSPDGTGIAAAYPARDKSYVIKLWDARTRQVIRTWKHGSDQTDDLAFTPDGKRLAFAGSAFRETKRLSPTQSQGVNVPAVVVWDLGSGAEVFRLADTGGKLAFSADGRRLATLTPSGQIQVWDAAAGTVRQTITGPVTIFSALAFSPDGHTVASGAHDQVVRLWDVKSGRETRALRGHFGPIAAAAFSPDGKRLATAGTYGDRKENRAKGEVKLWHLGAPADPLTFAGAPRWVCCLAFSPDGAHVVTGHGDHVVRVWEARTGRCLRELRGHSGWVESVACSPDGRHLASATAARGREGQPGEIKIWDAATGREVRALTGQRGGILCLAYSPDGKRLAAGGWGAKAGPQRVTGEAKVWDTASGKEVLTLDDHNQVHGVAFSHDGYWLFTADTGHFGPAAGVSQWDASTGRLVHTFAGVQGGFERLGITRDARLLAAWDGRSIYVWDHPSGRELCTLPTDALVRALAFSPDGTRVAAACGDHTVRIWDILTGQLVFTLRGHGGPVEGVAFSPDGHRLASGGAAAGGEGGEVRIWDATPLAESAAGQGGK
jgi:WD40 repeat protein